MFARSSSKHYFERHSAAARIRNPKTCSASGRQRPGDAHEPFCMTVLAIRLANHCNGVSALHGKVSRQDVEEHLARPARRRRPDHVDHQRRFTSQSMALGGNAQLFTTATWA
jgi:glucan phosphorylase